MKNTLNKIQKLFKAGSIISKIVLWCSIVGGISCLILLIAQLIVGNSRIITDSSIVKEYFLSEGSFNLETLLVGTIIGIIVCVCNIINAKLSVDYFDAELKEGSPFTIELSNQLNILGRRTIIISIINIVLVSTTYEIFSHFYTLTNELDISNISSIWIGLVFMFVSLLCRYVAEEKNA